MGWSALTVSSGGLIKTAAPTEVKAAIDERADVVSTSKPAAISSGDLRKWTDVTGYRGKIELLIPKFYKKSGSGTSTTFNSYSKYQIMTECFGTSDWPNKDNKLALASHWNDMRDVLNKLLWVKVDGEALGQNDTAYLNSSGHDATKDDAQDGFDNAVTIETVTQTDHMYAGLDAYWGYPHVIYGDYWVAGKKDINGIEKATLPNFDINDTYIGVNLTNYEHDGSPEQSADYDFYTGTALPGTNYAAITNYGSISNNGLANTVSGFIPGTVIKYFPQNYNLLTKNTTNYIRIAGKDALKRELTDQTWDATTRFLKQAAVENWDVRIMLKLNFEYKAA